MSRFGVHWRDASGGCIRQVGRMPMPEHLAQWKPKEEDVGDAEFSSMLVGL